MTGGCRRDGRAHSPSSASGNQLSGAEAGVHDGSSARNGRLRLQGNGIRIGLPFRERFFRRPQSLDIALFVHPGDFSHSRRRSASVPAGGRRGATAGSGPASACRDAGEPRHPQAASEAGGQRPRHEGSRGAGLALLLGPGTAAAGRCTATRLPLDPVPRCLRPVRDHDSRRRRERPPPVGALPLPHRSGRAARPPGRLSPDGRARTSVPDGEAGFGSCPEGPREGWSQERLDRLCRLRVGGPLAGNR